MKIPTTKPPILAVCEQLGIQLIEASGELCCSCPSPDHPDNNPSCYINEEKGLFYCHGCGAGGDGIALYMLAKSCSRQEAMEHLSDISDKPQPFPPLVSLTESDYKEGANLFCAIMKHLGQTGRKPSAQLLATLENEDPTETIRRMSNA